jgi:hypothetical protein
MLRMNFSFVSILRQTEIKRGRERKRWIAQQPCGKLIQDGGWSKKGAKADPQTIRGNYLSIVSGRLFWVFGRTETLK